jgi:hypothetical protein
MNNDLSQLRIVWENSKHKEIYKLRKRCIRRPTICIELGDFQDRFEITPTEGIAQDITVIIDIVPVKCMLFIRKW